MSHAINNQSCGHLIACLFLPGRASSRGRWLVFPVQKLGWILSTYPAWQSSAWRSFERDSHQAIQDETPKHVCWLVIARSEFSAFLWYLIDVVLGKQRSGGFVSHFKPSLPVCVCDEEKTSKKRRHPITKEEQQTKLPTNEMSI